VPPRARPAAADHDQPRRPSDPGSRPPRRAGAGTKRALIEPTAPGVPGGNARTSALGRRPRRRPVTRRDAGLAVCRFEDAGAVLVRALVGATSSARSSSPRQTGPAALSHSTLCRWACSRAPPSLALRGWPPCRCSRRGTWKRGPQRPTGKASNAILTGFMSWPHATRRSCWPTESFALMPCRAGGGPCVRQVAAWPLTVSGE
jgi:hypothetical protein